MSVKDFPIQKKNQCGMYAVWFVLSRLTNEKLSPEEVHKSMPWRIPFFGTTPRGIVVFLKRYGLRVTKKYLFSLSDKGKMQWLSRQLKDNNCIIILGKHNREQHYVVLYSYKSDSNTCIIYDPLVGKKEWFLKDVLSFWSGGGVFGFYRWYAIVASILSTNI